LANPSTKYDESSRAAARHKPRHRSGCVKTCYGSELQMTAEVEGDVSMATVTSAEDITTKPQQAMSARASAFTIASLMADHDVTGCCVVSTSNAATDSDCVSTSGTCCGCRHRRDTESPSASLQNCSGCAIIGMFRLLYVRCAQLLEVEFNLTDKHVVSQNLTKS